MKYSMYNVVFYDGVNAYVSKFVLKQNKEQAKKDLSKFWTVNGYDGEILKIDQLYTVNFEDINALNNGDNKERNTFNHFIEMYFLEREEKTNERIQSKHKKRSSTYINGRKMLLEFIAQSL